MSQHLSKAREFSRDSPAQQQAMAIVVQAETARKPERPVGWQVPRDGWRQVMRSVGQARTLCVSEPAIHFKARDEILAAEIAMVGRRLHRQRMACADRIRERPGLAGRDELGEDMP